MVWLPARAGDLTGMRIAIGFGWTTQVAAEDGGCDTGLGQMVLNASESSAHGHCDHGHRG